MIGFSRRLMMPADSAHLLLFHPDDLSHAAGWPRDWYRAPFAWGPESARGALVAWSTGTAGSFAVRLTTGALSAREHAYAGPQWTFPYTVRHGRVYFDNGDALPSQGRCAAPSDNADYWVKLPDGDYAVTVTGIEWQAEPGADAAPDKLPNYVVQFAPVTDVHIGLARRPPDIVALSDAAASDVVTGDVVTGDVTGNAVDRAVAGTALVDSAAYYPAFESNAVCRAGRVFAVDADVPLEAVLGEGAQAHTISRAVSHALSAYYFIAAPRLEPGAPGMLCEYLQASAKTSAKASADGDAHPRPCLRALAAVEILALDGVYQQGAYRDLKREGWLRKRCEAKPEDALWAVRCRTWSPAPDIVPHAMGAQGTGARLMGEEVRAVLLHDLQPNGYLGARLGAMAGYHRRWAGVQDDAVTLADWLLDQAVPPDTAMALSLLPPNQRVEAVVRAYYSVRGKG